MIISGWIIIDLGAAGVGCTPGQLLVSGSRIDRVELGSFDSPIGTPDLGGPDCLISPGFIDAHLHLPQFDCIGVDGLTLLDWLFTAVFPTEAAWADADFAAERALRAGRRVLSLGTTGIAAYATVHHAAAVRAQRALADLGLRGCVGQVLMDRNAREDLLRPAAQLIKEAATHQTIGRIAPAVTPRFAVSCTPELLHGAGQVAKATGWAVQTHLSESLEECSFVSRLFPESTSYTDVYARAGLLTPTTILGHAIHLAQDEVDAIAKSGAIIAHCPTANLFLQSGLMNRASYLHSDAKVVLGSDIAGGPDPSMIRVARAMIETAKARVVAGFASADAVPTPAQAWRQITTGNAEALGWHDAGRLAPGAAADIVVIRAPKDQSLGRAQQQWMSSPDPISAVIYGFDQSWVDKVVLNGQIIDPRRS